MISFYNLDYVERSSSANNANYQTNEINELADFIGLSDKVRNDIIPDYFIRNYFEYESNNAKPIIKGRLKSAAKYWEEVIKAPHSIIQVIKEGFCIDFITEPPELNLRNNNSAFKNSEFVTKAVTELLENNLIKKVNEKPKVISPLSVSKNSNKPRLILDLSVLNEYIPNEKIKLEDQNDFFYMARFCEYIVTYDIKSCYHQIDVNVKFHTYLGFEWTIDGVTSYFVFTVIPFGLCCGPRICKLLFRPLVTRWRLNGVMNVLFYDDGIIGACDYYNCKAGSEFVFNDLMLCHILPNVEKSCWEPQKCLDWLGYTWDLNDYVVRASTQRTRNLIHRINNLKNCLPIVTARKVALVVGSLISMIFVLGEKALLYSRYMQNIINYRDFEDLSWDDKININHVVSGSQVLKELEFIENNINDINLRFLKSRISVHKIMFGDAGEFGAGGFLMDGNKKLMFRVDLPEALKGTSSTERELFAVLEGLKSFQSKICNNKLIYVTDSKSCDLICRKGSGKMNLQYYAKKIDDFTRLYDINFSTAWINRELNQEADDLSKVKDPDDWSISNELFIKIKKLSNCEFSLDPFASSNNAKCTKFYSRYMCPGSYGVNGLAFPWTGEVCWLCPPPSLSLKTLIHFRSCKAKGVLVIPDWGSLPLVPLLEINDFKNYLIQTWRFPGRFFLEGKSELFNKDFKGALKILYFDFSCLNV